jgi:RNA polymerase sigma-70 factor (ECF subfamily)
VRSPHAIEDIRQETFSRVLTVLRSETGLRQPEKLGAFVNSTCNNVLLEYYRSTTRDGVADEDATERDYPDSAPDTLASLVTRQVQHQVRQILAGLSDRDRRLIQEVLLEERSKDEICEELGVDRDYLRVLLHRAKQSFKTQYLQSATQGIRPPLR